MRNGGDEVYNDESVTEMTVDKNNFNNIDLNLDHITWGKDFLLFLL